MLLLFVSYTQPWHMSAASLNAFHNVWLRNATGNPDLTLNVNNHPLPRDAEAEVIICMPTGTVTELPVFPGIYTYTSI